MCCRYYYDQLRVNDILERLGILKNTCGVLPSGVINPGSPSLMLAGGQNSPRVSSAVWGFPGREGGLVINARSETASEKPMFRDALQTRRCLLPAERFWEWDRSKNKVGFTDPQTQIIFLAGLWNLYGGKARFTVLTTAANASVQPVHDRMPLMVDGEHIEPWLTDNSFALTYLSAAMPPLRTEREYEQLSLI